MNREQRRKQAKGFTPYEFDKMQNNLRYAIRKECQEDADRRIKAFIQSYTTLVIYVLWYKFGMGQKRIAKFSDELRSHLDILEQEKKYGLTIDDMYRELRDNAKIDLHFLDDGKKIDRK